MFNVGDTAQYIGLPPHITTNGWSFKVAKVENGRVFAPKTGKLQFNYIPRELKLISKAPTTLWGVRILSYIGGTKLLTCPNRFYSRKHAQQWARTFKARFGMGLIRFETFAR